MPDHPKPHPETDAGIRHARDAFVPGEVLHDLELLLRSVPGIAQNIELRLALEYFINRFHIFVGKVDRVHEEIDKVHAESRKFRLDLLIAQAANFLLLGPDLQDRYPVLHDVLRENRVDAVQDNAPKIRNELAEQNRRPASPRTDELRQEETVIFNSERVLAVRPCVDSDLVDGVDDLYRGFRPPFEVHIQSRIDIIDFGSERRLGAEREIDELQQNRDIPGRQRMGTRSQKIERPTALDEDSQLPLPDNQLRTEHEFLSRILMQQPVSVHRAVEFNPIDDRQVNTPNHN